MFVVSVRRCQEALTYWPTLSSDDSAGSEVVVLSLTLFFICDYHHEQFVVVFTAYSSCDVRSLCWLSCQSSKYQGGILPKSIKGTLQVGVIVTVSSFLNCSFHSCICLLHNRSVAAGT